MGGLCAKWRVLQVWKDDAHTPLPGLMEHLKVPNFKTDNVNFTWPQTCTVPCTNRRRLQGLPHCKMEHGPHCHAELFPHCRRLGHLTGELFQKSSVASNAIHQLTKAADEDAKSTTTCSSPKATVAKARHLFVLVASLAMHRKSTPTLTPHQHQHRQGCHYH